jgi:hypothetical protein
LAREGEKVKSEQVEGTRMLKIRDEQFDAFLPRDDEELIAFIVKHLQEEAPELVDRIPPDALRTMVGNGVARARGHGLRTAEDLTAFGAVTFELTSISYEKPTIRCVLRDERVPAGERVDLLFERVSGEA